MHVHHVGRSFRATCAVLALLCLLAACGGGGGSSSTASSTPSPSATTSPGCKDAAALESSLKALERVDVQKDGIGALTSAVADVARNLDAAVASASANLKPHINQLKTAFSALQASLSGLSAQNLRQKLPSIKAALVQIGTATTALASAVADGCPSG